MDKFEILVRDYGLDLILEQNDLTHEDVIEILVDRGLIDLEDYFYNELEVGVDD